MLASSSFLQGFSFFCFFFFSFPELLELFGGFFFTNMMAESLYLL